MGKDTSRNKEQRVGNDLRVLGNPEIREKILGNGGLPNLDEITTPNFSEFLVPAMTEEEREQIEEEYRKRRNFAEGAGKRIATIEQQFEETVKSLQQEIAEIEAEPEKLELIPTLQKRLRELKDALAKSQKERQEALNKLLVKDEGVRKHTEFAAFLERVRQAKPQEAEAFLNLALQMGRIKKTNEPKGKPNILHYRGKAYEPVPDGTGKITQATLAVIAELRRLLDAAKVTHREEVLKKIEALKAKATPGLTLTKIAKEHLAGSIYLFLPAREERTKSGVQRIPESHLLVECDGKVIRPLEAVGRLKEFWERLKEKSRYLTLADFCEGRITRKLPEETLRELQRFLGILRAGMAQESRAVGEETSSEETPSIEETAPAETSFETSSGD